MVRDGFECDAIIEMPEVLGGAVLENLRSHNDGASFIVKLLEQGELVNQTKYGEIVFRPEDVEAYKVWKEEYESKGYKPLDFVVQYLNCAKINTIVTAKDRYGKLKYSMKGIQTSDKTTGRFGKWEENGYTVSKIAKLNFDPSHKKFTEEKEKGRRR